MVASAAVCRRERDAAEENLAAAEARYAELKGLFGGAVDLVTTSPEEAQRAENERLRKENDELRRQQAQKPR